MKFTINNHLVDTEFVWDITPIIKAYHSENSCIYYTFKVLFLHDKDITVESKGAFYISNNFDFHTFKEVTPEEAKRKNDISDEFLKIELIEFTKYRDSLVDFVSEHQPTIPKFNYKQY